MIKRFSLVCAALLVGLAVATPSYAGGVIVGSIGLADNNKPTASGGPTPVTVATATTFSFESSTTATKDGDFAGIAIGTGFVTSPETIHFTAGNLLGMPFTMGNSTFGHFTAESGSLSQFTVGTSHFANITMNGIFTPGSLLSAYSANDQATLTLTYSQVGRGSISDSGTLAMAVPEPASFAMLGIGMAGFIAVRRFVTKRRNAV
jgi:hypothetical protein